ncbi:FAD/NAD(P)-binding protein [Pseudochelatococcus lubricantis]|uniref:FAD/NAD(P)-binding protein n=1 Tax=Pseudochelatococcus lubricantis TaxID=1538102 RepID=UPI0035F06499
MSSHPYSQRVVIIGGGFAGAATAIKLIDAAAVPLRLTIVDPAADIGRGIAYSTPDPDHVVNGVAQLFGLFPEDPDHLVRWLAERAARGGWQAPGGNFPKSSPPRWLYGDYVNDTFRQAVARGEGRVAFEHVRERAVDLDAGADGVSVRLASGRQLPADRVILATGLYPRRSPVTAPEGVRAEQYYVDDLWKDGIDPSIFRKRHVLLLGSSLTMLDSLITLEKGGFRGHYTIVSRRGLIVQPRRDVTPLENGLADVAVPATALGALRIAQRLRRTIAAQGDDWQRLAPTLRAHLPVFWTGLSTRERLRFVRHLRSYWDISLHRAAAASHAFLARVEAQGRVTRLGARVLGLEIRPGEGVAVSLRRRGEQEPATLHADAVINSAGHEFDWTRIDDPLVASLLAKGFVRPHATRYGIDADPEALSAIGRDGAPSPVLSAVGHPLRGVSWESSAIREQLEEAIQLSRVLFAARPEETQRRAAAG